jgi:hypothetical protein
MAPREGLTRCISEEYFAAMGIPLLAGRTFTAADESTDAPLVGIIDQHMARDLFPGRDPLQAILRVNATRSIRIVGVVKDAAQGLRATAGGRDVHSVSPVCVWRVHIWWCGRRAIRS